MASTPSKTEALAQPITVSYDGTDYTFPPAQEWDLDALEAYEDGRVLTMLRTLLGAEQWAAFRATPRTAKHLDEFMDALASATGVPGN